MANLLEQASIILTPTAYDNGSMLSVKPENGDGDFTFSRASSATRVNANGLIESVVSEIPRVDYTDSSCGSWLLEPQATNLVITSDSGVYGSSPASEILETSPDGTNNAVRPVPSTGSNRYQETIAGGVYSSGQKLTYSWYRKRISTPVDDTFVGDLRINVLVNITVFEATTQIQSNINGYDRFQVVIQITDGSLSSTFRAYFGAIIGTGNSSVAYWGHQYEIGGYATSIIPTSGTTVTRNQDLATNSGNSTLINSSEGVFYVEIAALAEEALIRYITISDGTTSNRIIIYITDVGVIKFNVVVGGATQAAKVMTGQTTTNFNKLAVSYKENDIRFYINGVKVKNDTTALAFPINTLNVINFAASNGGGVFYGKTKALAVFKTALTDAELISLTTI